MTDSPHPETRKILILSYLFPPMGGIGVQRALSLAKYLPSCGFEVHVLKASNAGGPVRDPELLRQIPPGVRVHQAFTPEIPFALRQRLWAKVSGNKRAPATAPANKQQGPGILLKSGVTWAVKRLLCPEPEVLWVPFAVRKARRIIRRYQIDYLLVTVPPFSTLLAATALKREFPHVLLVSDFRDEWLTFYLRDFDFQNSDYTRRRAEAIEREAVERSDLVVAVNGSSRSEIRRRYPAQPEAKFAVVPNGYDPETFAGFQPRRNELPRLLVTHVGTVYKTASPRYYLEAVDGLPEEVRRNIETRFVGRVSDAERAFLESRGGKVTVLGFLPQASALKYMEDTDYLLLTMTDTISVPGKLFEYMATGKPILAVTPPGSEVDRILRETGSGVSACPTDAAALRRMLLAAFAAWQQKRTLLAPDPASARRYERPRLAREYGELMRAVNIV